MPTADAAGGGDDLALIAFEAVPDPRPTFDDFWAVYPLHTGKIAARRVWDRVVAKGTDPQEIVDGATRYANDPNLPVDKSKIKYPQGWLNDGRWMDGPLPARLGDRPQRVQYNDALTWGDEEHRKSIAEARRNMTQAEIDAAVAEAFGDDEQH